MRMAASWFGSLDSAGYKVAARFTAPESGLPSDRRPDRCKRAVVLEAVKVWPGKGGECGKAGAAANLDSSCARRQSESAVGAEEKPAARSNKRKKRTTPVETT
jgi:hypothetical protein